MGDGGYEETEERDRRQPRFLRGLPPVFAEGCRLLCRADFCPLDCGAFLHVVRRTGNFNVRAVSIGIGQDNHRCVCLEEVGILIGF